jgi:mechanosensitive ion channel-like protein
MTQDLALNVGSSITSALSTVANFVPKLVLFVVIMVVGWIVAKVLRGVLARVLARIGFDRVADRGGINRWLGNNTASGLVARLVYYAILLFALQLGFGVFGPNPVSNMINGVVNFLPKAFVAIVIVVIAAAIGGAVRDIVVSTLGRLSYGRLLGTIAQVAIIALGVIAALNQIGVATSVTMPVLIAVLATVAGVIVVGVGGGLVMPMRDRWERMLHRAEGEASNLREARSQSAQHDVQGGGGQHAAQPGMPTGQQQMMAGQPGRPSGYSMPPEGMQQSGGPHTIPPAYGGMPPGTPPHDQH